MSNEESPAFGGSAGAASGLGDLPFQYGAADVPPVAQHANPSDVTLALLRRAAAAFGLSLAARCTRCGAPLWAAASVAAKLGPTCARRGAGK
ncbi:DUF6011 domain-containing protein [Pseudarthrobacter sp. NPDC092184]|uniref:DUF6011 domain-containing protein n=1 Tax=unclassified Pseudarthrobacter TaxID=2647000 RepID=UPI0038285361